MIDVGSDLLIQQHALVVKNLQDLLVEFARDLALALAMLVASSAGGFALEPWKYVESVVVVGGASF